MMICPYCEQGNILNVVVKKSGRKVLICEECDTIWLREIDVETGIGFDTFMSNEVGNANWSELKVLAKHIKAT